MLNNEIIDNELFKELQPIADSMGYSVVDVIKTVHNSEIHIAITICVKSGDTGIDDCEKFHRTVMPRLELTYGRDNLSMEVSTPGLQRAFRDCHEFSVFTGKKVRAYILSLSTYVTGTVESTEPDSVSLVDVVCEDDNSHKDSMKIKFNDIQKAKLEYAFAKKGDK